MRVGTYSPRTTQDASQLLPFFEQILLGQAVLGVGHRGAGVESLQRGLASAGLLGQIDGSFGPETRAAVTALQAFLGELLGLDAVTSGALDSATLSALSQASGQPVRGYGDLESALTRALRRPMPARDSFSTGGASVRPFAPVAPAPRGWNPRPVSPAPSLPDSQAWMNRPSLSAPPADWMSRPSLSAPGPSSGLISDRAKQLIKDAEGYDQPGRWPGGSSGVTIGVGYDLGYVTREEFRRDWGSRLDPSTFQRLEGVVGLKGENARAASRDLKDIRISQSSADQVFDSATLPKFVAETRRAFPGYDRLPKDAQGALVSLVFNRGASMSGERRTEMRALRDAVARGDLSDAAHQIRSMKRLWVGQGLDGLLTRRENEARLFERAA